MFKEPHVNGFRVENISACYHFAAYAAEGLSPFIRHFNYTNNVLASMSVINACINHDVKMIFTSSMAVYGDRVPASHMGFSESQTPRPIDPYGVAKWAVEMDLKIAGEQHGLKYTIVRPHNVVGIYQNIWDKYRNVVGIFIRRAIDGEPLIIFGDGFQTRAFSDIKFYMDPFHRMIEEGNAETFNIGADGVFTLNELASVVQRVAWRNGYECELDRGEARHEAKHAHCDHTKAQKMLGFNDGTDLEALVDEMFKWALTQPKRETKQMKYEVEKGIYEYWK
jgi:UDP-glucose 4-epimerase